MFEGLRTGVLNHIISVLVKLVTNNSEWNRSMFEQVDSHLDLIEGQRCVPYVEGNCLKFKTVGTPTSLMQEGSDNN